MRVGVRAVTGRQMSEVTLLVSAAGRPLVSRSSANEEWNEYVGCK